MNILLGHDRHTGKPVYFPVSALKRHLHLVAATGAGKTTAILTLLIPLFLNPFLHWCFIIIDRLGGFSLDLARWAASEFCPQWVRDRFVFIRYADESVTVPINPFRFRTLGEMYYCVARAIDLMLRGGDYQNILAMPRLFRNLFNAFYGAAQIGLTVGDTEHILNPHSELHAAILSCFPPLLRGEWKDVIEARGGHNAMLLDSVRNKMKPFHASPVLRNPLSYSHNCFDVRRFQQEHKIVVIDLSPGRTLPEVTADILGAMIVNEVYSTARSTPPEERIETLLVLDEFQRFINPDLELGLAESRQLGVKGIYSHQSMSQLKKGDVDLSNLVFQCGCRLILNLHGPDATFFGEELAAYDFDPYRIKQEIYHRQQRIVGHRVVELASRSFSEQQAQKWSEKYGASSTEQQDRLGLLTGKTIGTQSGRETGGTTGTTSSRGTHESLVPIYDEYVELASREFVRFEEDARNRGRNIRHLQAGQGILRIAGDDHLHDVQIKQSAVGHLKLPWDDVKAKLPNVAEAYEQFLEANKQQDCFRTPAEIATDTKQRLERVLRKPIVLNPSQPTSVPLEPEGENEEEREPLI